MDGKAGHGILPPRPPVTPLKIEAQKHHLVARPGCGTEGRRIRMFSNYFTVKLNDSDKVSIKYDDREQRPVEGKGVGRKIMDRLYQTYNSELARKDFAYDGEKCLYTVGPLPQNKLEFKVVLEESSARSGGGGSPQNGTFDGGDLKRSRRVHHTQSFIVELSFAVKIPMRSIANAIRGIESDETFDALRVLDIILRQQQAKRGCLLVRQSFFNDSERNLVGLGEGVSGCRGFHASFRAIQNGLSLNMDVSTTMTLTPGPVIDFLLTNQNVREPWKVDWVKAKRMLKNMRIRTKHSKMEFKIIGFSELPCNQQLFTMKIRNGEGEGQTVELTVSDYFLKKNIELSWSASTPCLDVGRPKKPNYMPIELCDLVPLQRYTKSLSRNQRAALVEKSRQKPQERIKVVTDAVSTNRYNEEPMLAACGISIDKQLVMIEGRVLTAPSLKIGGGEDFFPRNGRWNFNNKTLLEPVKIDRWAIVNFSARCDMSFLSRELINCARNKGMIIDRPFTLIEEDPHNRRAGPVTRVEEMFKLVMSKLPGPPEFLLCILPERKNSEIYGPWKKKNLHEHGIITQCIAPMKINDQYLTNVLLKINAKLGGLNSVLSIERAPTIPLIAKIPTLILGMDVSHGSPGRADIPSVAAVVGSRSWPLISRYRASVRAQSPKVEMIDSLYKLLPNGEDDGVIKEILVDFYQTSNHRKPGHVIIFRDGVSESQFSQVLDIELDQIMKAIEKLGVETMPKFTVIVAQKNHYTKLFLADSPDNVPPGTVVDTKVTHPRNYDFFMCAHNGLLGTSRPTHYHVLLDQIGFSPDDLQKLVHSLSYVSNCDFCLEHIKINTNLRNLNCLVICTVAPIAYAHLAAQQVSQFVKFEDMSDNSSGLGVTASGPASVPELPKLHKNVRSTMFFC